MPPKDPPPERQITCEFTTPCTTTPLDPKTNLPTPPLRKVISHIFGRNKTATKQFPPTVWVHYCRKHYQRARYRSTQWPFTQCELIADSLWRMERWGGVQFFDVVLRRREVERLGSSSSASSSWGSFGSGSGSGSRAQVQARVQVQVQVPSQSQSEETGGDAAESETGYMEDDDEETPDEAPSPRRLRSSSRNASANTDSTTDKVKSRGKGKGKATTTKPKSQAKTKGKGKAKAKAKPSKTKRKTPQIKTAPVPDWLHAEVGPNKTFAEIRHLLHRLMNHMEAQRDAGLGGQIRFPDIEILPTFYPWVKAVEDDDGEAGDEGGSSGESCREDEEEGEVVDRRVTRASAARVSRKGGVRKVH